MDRVAAGPDVAVAGDRVEPVDEVGVAGGHRDRIPAQPVRVRLDLVERGAAERPVADPGELWVRGRRHDPVYPGPPVHRPRLGERGSAELLGVQAQRRALRRVTPGGQRPRHGLAGELVPEPPLVGELARAGPVGRLLADIDVGHDCLLAHSP